MLEEIKKEIINKHLIFILEKYENFFNVLLNSFIENTPQLPQLIKPEEKEKLNLFYNEIKEKTKCDKVDLLESQDINGFNLFITYKDKKIKIKLTLNTNKNKITICIGFNNIYLDKDKTSIAPNNTEVKTIFANYKTKEYKFNILKRTKINSTWGVKEVVKEELLSDSFFDVRFDDFTNYLKDGNHTKEIENAITYYALVNNDSMLLAAIINNSNIKGIIEKESLILENICY